MPPQKNSVVLTHLHTVTEKLPAPVPRRALLRWLAIASAGGATALVSGCELIPSTKTTFRLTLLDEQFADESALYDSYTQFLARRTDLNETLSPLRDHHRHHLDALANRGASSHAAPTPSTTMSTDIAPTDDAQAALSAFSSAEKSLRDSTIARCLKFSDSTERGTDAIELLGSIAAGQASYVAALAKARDIDYPQAPSFENTSLGNSTTSMAIWQQVLAGEHAAIYAYGVLGAQLKERLRPVAEQVESRHRARRDLLTAAINSGGGDPVPAASSYQVPYDVTDNASALRLGVLVEQRTATQWCALLPLLSGSPRRTGLNALIDCAMQATIWSGANTSGRASTSDFPGK